MKRVAVLGAGSWGTALAAHVGRLGHPVALWGRDSALIRDLQARRANAVYLQDVVLPATVTPTADLGVAVDGADYVVIAVPSHGVRALMAGTASALAPNAIVVSATKGIEEGTLLRASEVIAECVEHRVPIVALSGPTFASEVARQLPTVVLVASTDSGAAAAVQHEFRAQTFRLYVSDDVVGVEIGGAVKNVIAIAAGVVESLGLGHNAMAGLITRGLAEMSRLAVALGARRDTLSGLSGLGDLVLTCTGALSRNRHLGIELGRGRPLHEIVAGMKMVAEGVRTTHAALALGAHLGVELPIALQVDALLAGRVTPAAAVAELMGRRQKAESD